MGLLNEAYIYQLCEDIWKVCKDNIEPVQVSRDMMVDKLTEEFEKILGEDFTLDDSGICTDLAYEIVNQYADFEERAENRELSPWQEAQSDLVNETMRNL